MSAREVLGRLYRGETRINFVGRRRTWFLISGIFLLISVLALPLRPTTSSCAPPLPGFFKGLNCGIEFKGGVSIQAPIKPGSPLTDLDDLDLIAAVREAVGEVGVADPQVQVATLGDERSVIVQTTELGDIAAQDEFQDVVRELTGATVAESSPQAIGRKWGGEITRKAFRALFVFLVVVLLFISWRFEWKMAVAAIVALVHDLLITAGVYAIVGFELTPSTIIAILTILGFSLYDTVVVFDKVEENTALYATSGKMTYEASANLAMNQVVMRSLNTSVSALLPVAALLFVGVGLLGAGTLKDLALALLVGSIVSMYSSIFIATPVLTLLKEREPRYRNIREKVLREAARRAPAAAAVPAAEGLSLTEARAPSLPEVARVSGSRPAVRPAAKPRAGSKKARRRKRR